MTDGSMCFISERSPASSSAVGHWRPKDTDTQSSFFLLKAMPIWFQDPLMLLFVLLEQALSIALTAVLVHELEAK